MTDISSFIVSVIVSNSLVTYVTFKMYKIIPLRTIEYSYSHIYHLTDCLFTCFHGSYYYKIENMYMLLICMLYMDTCCYQRYL